MSDRSYVRAVLGLDPLVRVERASRARDLLRLMGQVLDKYEDGLSQRQTAAALGITSNRVFRLRAAIGLASNRRSGRLAAKLAGKE